ncbi:hypothetical protein M758_9G187600 [Ceratodon purpureus]|nr:hypothetical protein M758_9G187600 [Ceratodon purpureus]
MTRMRVLARRCEVLVCTLVLVWTISGAYADTGLFIAPICNVTEFSGLTTDCAQIISYLQFLGNADCCVHEHPSVNGCTTMNAFGTCRARICALPFVPLPRCQPCGVVAEYVRNLANLCAEPILGESRSGGFQVMKEDTAMFIVLY